MKHRLYIDEVGNPDLKSSRDPNHRYLSLTGVQFSLEYVDKVLYPELERLKKNFFRYHPDDPIILHRKKIVNKRHPFESLNDPLIDSNFRLGILALLRNLEYCVFTVVIDKLEHLNQYKIWHYDPYHYCLEIIIERYVLWLEENNSTGDVLAESRGGKEDMRLKSSFKRHYENGTRFISTAKMGERLTSCELKVKKKENNIAGLQIADLIAHPSFKATLARHHNQSLPKTFGGEIAKILEESKYYRSYSGRIEGRGRKWLP